MRVANYFFNKNPSQLSILNSQFKKMSLAKKLDIVAGILSAVVVVLVGVLQYLPPIELPFDVHILPNIHATFNALTVVVLLAALYFIKQKNIKAHQYAIYTAMGLSVLFLLSYVTYHAASEPVRYGGEGALKAIYFFLLITHIILAAIILPFILFTFVRGFTMQVEKHKRLARWTFPLWLYVAATGVICHLMLMQNPLIQ